MKQGRRFIELIKQEGIKAALSSSIEYGDVLIRNANPKRTFIFKSMFRYYYNSLSYDEVSHPFKIIEVSAKNVDYSIISGVSKYDGLGQIKSGSWKTAPLEEDPTYKGLMQRFTKGYDWKDTKYVEKADTKIDQQGHFWGYNSIDEFINDRCSFVDEIFENVKKNGYKPNYKRGHNVPGKDVRRGRYSSSLEPFVGIGKDGAIYNRTGTHRLTIASILDIQIPVYVIVRHKDWQHIRENVSNSNSDYTNYDSGILDHPDLNDVLGEDYEIWDW